MNGWQAGYGAQRDELDAEEIRNGHAELGGARYEPEQLDGGEPSAWPLSWRRLDPRVAWLWFEQLWMDVCMLRERYRLMLRSGWWEDEIQVESLAALAEWVARYDSGEWDDPPGKLALLYDLQRVAELLKPGLQPFAPERDRPAFESYLLTLGLKPAA